MDELIAEASQSSHWNSPAVPQIYVQPTGLRLCGQQQTHIRCPIQVPGLDLDWLYDNRAATDMHWHQQAREQRFIY